MEQGSTVDLYVLPEGCISNIISLTSPRDACRSSVISSVFRSATDSDSVWERFLPSDYKQILSSLVSPSPLVFSSKKDLYLHLCDNPVLIDKGIKTFALEKCSGKKCYMIGAKELSIVWGECPSYWNWHPQPESRFSEVAELLGVCWLEIRGKMETRLLSPNTTYVAYMVLKFTDSAYGFEFPPAEVSVKLASKSGGGGGGGDGGGEEEEMKQVYLNPIGRKRRQLGMYRRIGSFSRSLLFSYALRPQELLVEEDPQPQPQQESEVPNKREDGWMEIEMGEFFNEKGEDGELEMTLMEVKGGNWKGGLIIQGMEIRPKKIQ
ncbi:F-box protein PP2-B10-like [Telopea speciosissima]|uniref:F-box protein PP2-B10-like n=1 Tax=Telopea speciosissima TaxID=54955 RepID=UPI001CC6D073|nr:F-box protein PP2-B10-like [Telopea speciosissima]